MDHSVKDESGAVKIGEFFRNNLSWLLTAALALLLLQDIFGTHGLIAMRHSQSEAKEVQQQISQIAAENQRLEEQVKALKSDPAAIEHIAREDLGLARPGEHIFKLPPKSNGAATPSSPAVLPPQNP